MLQTVCSPRALELVLPTTVTALSCGGSNPLQIKFLPEPTPEKDDRFPDFLYNVPWIPSSSYYEATACKTPGLINNTRLISVSALPQSCKYTEMEKSYRVAAGKEFDRLFHVVCDAAELGDVPIQLHPNDENAVMELNDAVAPATSLWYRFFHVFYDAQVHLPYHRTDTTYYVVSVRWYGRCTCAVEAFHWRDGAVEESVRWREGAVGWAFC